MAALKKLYHYLVAVGAYWLYGRPARHIVVIGVTGTKGKSTTCRLIASVLEAAGHKVGLLSTVEFQVADKRWPNDRKMTMLGRGEIQKMLRAMVRAGCRYAVVETSSEGILQYRHYGLHYDIAVFTNLGTEHSERHGGFENLRADKGKLFAALRAYPRKVLYGQKIEKIAVANTDDANADFYLAYDSDKKYGYGTRHAPHPERLSGFVEGLNLRKDISGTVFAVEGKDYRLNIPGAFNVYNALAAIAVGRSQGIADEKITVGLASVKLVEGRMEFVEAGQDFKVIVDYAHEPMSLTELFTALREMLPIGGHLIGVVGSDGGGRDKGKRAKMGEVAAKLCDHVVITDVNCFDEDPSAIAEMLAVGARSAGKKDGDNLFIETDRRDGIARAFALARAGDIVAITAKGTEPCIVVRGGKKLPWDDRRVARELLAQPLVKK